ncbi:DUF5985 family protein [Chondromyces apiculatus]|uniref:Uncharacterized protein n=1 Tax=Chondromyces apiculatus DSM 436 TaxID=1192034 RepID=A0A017T2X3_9BACT|nr:DUF5985 family protein [Chondromyces apiculatus]EYF03357.1 Hypothetical protein CAP_5689 [Chondromyces apiculatus DSM 436]
MNEYIAGASTLGYAVVAMFFLRFWRQTSDRLFAIFSASFWLLCIGRITVHAVRVADDHLHYLYLFRLLAYVLILYAIIDKNRAKPSARPPVSG